MAISYLVDDTDLLIGIGNFRGDLSDRTNLLRIAGELMRASIARTFRDHNRGTWPALAASTLKKKGYGPGHKLLILSGRLFNSITYAIVNGVLNIGTNLIYAAIQQYGSKDRRGAAIGPQAKLADRAVKVAAHDFMRVSAYRRFGHHEITDSLGRKRNVRSRLSGPANAKKVHVGAHMRHQNIPPRAFVVFRPEDPERITTAFDRYLSGRAVSIGRVGA
jgi:phage gpG-like protein